MMQLVNTISLLLSATLPRVSALHSHPEGLHPYEQVLDAAVPVKRVAIIGAGAAGSSAAYHLRQFAQAANIPVNITIFDRNSYIGGRSTTVNAYNATNPPPEGIIELGASIFVQVNHILVNATDTFNLTTTSFSTPTTSGPLLGIYNGESFVFTQNAGTAGGVWDTVKLLWRYGYAPIKTMNLMKDVVGRFLDFYKAPTFPFVSLNSAVVQRGLSGVVAATGEQWLKENGVGDLFANEIVQASTRVNYAQNLPVIHGLETMVCMATDGAMSIEGGNWQMFHNLARNSTKDIRLETAVTALSKQEDATYMLKSKTTSLSLEGETIEKTSSATFDSVILAAPYQFTSMDIEPKPAYVPDKIPYVNLHVTLFTSPHALAPAAFNLNPEDIVPQVVLTTLLPSEHPGTTPIYPGKAGFYSISTLRTVTNPKTKKEEFVYKIFSPAPVTAEFLSRILDISTNTTSSTSPHLDFLEKDISWLYRKLWQSYPYEYPRQTFEELRLDENFWYTSGIESFISTMETSALMGMNVAKLVVDEWVGGRHPYFVGSLNIAPPQDDESAKLEL